MLALCTGLQATGLHPQSPNGSLARAMSLHHEAQPYFLDSLGAFPLGHRMFLFEIFVRAPTNLSRPNARQNRALGLTACK